MASTVKYTFLHKLEKIKKDNKEDPRVNPPHVDVVIIDGMK